MVSIVFRRAKVHIYSFLPIRAAAGVQGYHAEAESTGGREQEASRFRLQGLRICVQPPERWILPPDYISNKFSAVLEKAGLPHMRFHDLRHSAASVLYDLGWDIERIKSWLRHSDIKTTSNIYLHISKERRRIDALELAGLYNRTDDDEEQWCIVMSAGVVPAGFFLYIPCRRRGDNGRVYYCNIKGRLVSVICRFVINIPCANNDIQITYSVIAYLLTRKKPSQPKLWEPYRCRDNSLEFH